MVAFSGDSIYLIGDSLVRFRHPPWWRSHLYLIIIFALLLILGTVFWVLAWTNTLPQTSGIIATLVVYSLACLTFFYGVIIWTVEYFRPTPAKEVSFDVVRESNSHIQIDAEGNRLHNPKLFPFPLKEPPRPDICETTEFTTEDILRSKPNLKRDSWERPIIVILDNDTEIEPSLITPPLRILKVKNGSLTSSSSVDSHNETSTVFELEAEDVQQPSSKTSVPESSTKEDSLDTISNTSEESCMTMLESMLEKLLRDQALHNESRHEVVRKAEVDDLRAQYTLEAGVLPYRTPQQLMSSLQRMNLVVARPQGEGKERKMIKRKPLPILPTIQEEDEFKAKDQTTNAAKNLEN